MIRCRPQGREASTARLLPNIKFLCGNLLLSEMGGTAKLSTHVPLKDRGYCTQDMQRLFHILYLPQGIHYKLLLMSMFSNLYANDTTLWCFSKSQPFSIYLFFSLQDSVSFLNSDCHHLYWHEPKITCQSDEPKEERLRKPVEEGIRCPVILPGLFWPLV